MLLSVAGSQTRLPSSTRPWSKRRAAAAQFARFHLLNWRGPGAKHPLSMSFCRRELSPALQLPPRTLANQSRVIVVLSPQSIITAQNDRLKLWHNRTMQCGSRKRVSYVLESV